MGYLCWVPFVTGSKNISMPQLGTLWSKGKHSTMCHKTGLVVQVYDKPNLYPLTQSKIPKLQANSWASDQGWLWRWPPPQCFSTTVWFFLIKERRKIREHDNCWVTTGVILKIAYRRKGLMMKDANKCYRKYTFAPNNHHVFIVVFFFCFFFF